MARDDVRICPPCGARNKAKWEYCARCGAALADVPLESATTAASQEPEAEDTGSNFPVAAIFALVLLGVGAWFVLGKKGDAPAERPDPAAFTFLTLPTAPPSPAPARSAVTDAEDLFRRGRSALARGEFETAVQLIRQAIALVPDTGRYHDGLAAALWRLGPQHRSEALSHRDEAIRLDPTVAEYHAAKARAMHELSRLNEAVSSFNDALALEPKNGEYVHSLARVYQALNDDRVALRLFGQAAALRPRDAVVRQDWAYALDRAGELDAAVEQYNLVVAQLPDAAITRGLLAEVLMRQGKPDDAAQVFRDGIQRTPNNALLQRGYGSILERSGKLGEAAAAYHNYARLAPQSSDAQEIERRATMLEERSAAGPEV